MIKKITLPMIIIAMVIQLLVPVGMIAYSQSVEQKVLEFGTEYKIDININSVMDGKVIFSPKISELWLPLYDNEYVILATDENGKAYCSEISKQKPDSEDYLRPTRRNSNRLYSYKVDCDGEILSSRYYNLYETDSYIIAKVYKGNIAVTGLYIESLPAERWIAEFDEASIFDNYDKTDANEIIWEEENLFGE